MVSRRNFLSLPLALTLPLSAFGSEQLIETSCLTRTPYVLDACLREAALKYGGCDFLTVNDVFEDWVASSNHLSGFEHLKGVTQFSDIFILQEIYPVSRYHFQVMSATDGWIDLAKVSSSTMLPSLFYAGGVFGDATAGPEAVELFEWQVARKA